MDTKKKSFSLYFGVLYGMAGASLAMAIAALCFGRGPAAITAGTVALVEGILALIVRRQFKRNIRKNTLKAALSLEKEYKQQMDQWEQPMLLLAADGCVVWENKAFEEMPGAKPMLGRYVDELNMGLDDAIAGIDWEPVTKETVYRGRDYLVTLRKVRVDEPISLKIDDRDYSRIYSISFKDCTRIRELEKENEDLQPIAALIYVDNYEQVFESMDDSRKPLLEALIYRSINTLCEEVEGVLIRLEKNRFYMSFHHRYLAKVEEERFRILEDTKKISSGNKYPPTLSIGVGAAHDIYQARELAREAVDLALGRGGDQAVVKTADRQSFYGGNSAAIESQSRVRPRQVAYALKEEMEHVGRVLIMGHANPDMDSLGACLGLYRMAALVGKPAHIILGDEHPAVEEFYRRIMNEPEAAYAIIGEDQAKEYIRNEEVLLLITDCSRPGMTQAPQLTELAKHVAIIDHHRRSEDSLRPEICYVETYVSSASEMVTELLRYTAEKPVLTQLEADGLFAGIVLDTKYFTVKSGVRTFEAAAFLRRQGADAERVRELFKDDMEEYKARGMIVSQARAVKNGVLVSLWKGTLPNAQAVAAQAADEMLDISGVNASYVITEIGDTIYLSARSLGNNNVQLVMEELGGGGHLNVAGAQLSGVTLEEAEQKLLEAIEKVDAYRRA